MFRFLQSKKGFTLVELMIVLVLISLGAFALTNLFRVAYRSFNKSEERYEKQETVKAVVDFLQKGTSVTAAQTADIFADIGVVPSGDKQDKSYSYLYTELKDMDGDGVYEGYYLYVLEAGVKRENAKLISEYPMYIRIDAFREHQYDDETSPIENKCAAKVYIQSLENGFDFGTPENPNIPVSDNIFYELDVTYHFPNMATSKTLMAVNFPNGDPGSTATEEARNSARAVAVTYDENGTEAGSAMSVDANGTVLRIFSDSILNGDNSDAAASMPSFCFVATASYGIESGEVGQLCDFRDNVLMKSELGKLFVKAYYTVSPPIAKFISGSDTLKAVVRFILKPCVMIAEYALHPDLLVQVAPYIAIAALTLISAVVLVNKQRHRHKAG